jgi:hypothetical protein
LRAKLKTLFWIAVTNFVFPSKFLYNTQIYRKAESFAVILNIIIVIDGYTDPNYAISTPNLWIVDYYISIIGVTFATGK